VEAAQFDEGIYLFSEDFIRFSCFERDNFWRLIIVNDVQQNKFCTSLMSQESRSPKRPVRSFGEISRRQNLLHVTNPQNVPSIIARGPTGGSPAGHRLSAAPTNRAECAIRRHSRMCKPTAKVLILFHLRKYSVICVRHDLDRTGLLTRVY
jgi:hypothetical protein